MTGRKVQKIFSEGCEHYNEATNLISTIASTLETYFISQGESFDASIVMKQFDLILQGILLNTAAADGRIVPEEIQFIKQIVRHGDLLAEINAEQRLPFHKQALVWEAFPFVDISYLKLLCDAIPKKLGKICDDFVLLLARVDSQLPTISLIDILSEKIMGICTALGKMDGHFSKEESRAAVDMFKKLLSERWNRISKSL